MSKSKYGLLSGIILIGLVLCSFSLHKKTTIMKVAQVELLNGATIYQDNFNQFNYYIETIGNVSIDKVALNNKKLTAIYSYKQGVETRHVISELQMDADGIYKGTCTTKVNGKTLFAVNTWLTFSSNGTAKGNWSWSGNPTKQDPIVNITKL